MVKTDKAALRQIESDYEKACNAWVRELARMWGQDYMEGYWIGDEPGGVYDFNGECPLDMQDIIYIVRNGINYEQASDWQEYAGWITEYEEYGFEVPTLREYVEYLVPLLDGEAQLRIIAKRREIDKMKDELFLICDDEIAKARTRLADSQNMTRHVKD
jgi:hypothetical protein